MTMFPLRPVHLSARHLRRAGLLAGILFSALMGHGQEIGGQVAARIDQLHQQGASFTPISLVTETQVDARAAELWQEASSRAEVLRMNGPAVMAVLGAAPATMSVTLPAPGGEVVLELEKWNPFADDFTVTTSSGDTEELEPGVHYRGKVQGSSRSVAGLSVFRDEVVAVASDARGTLVVGRLKNADEDLLVSYWEDDLLSRNPFTCVVEETGLPPVHPGSVEGSAGERTLRCVKLYWEVDYSIFQELGSVSAATNYATAIFNQSAILFDNDGINVQLQQVYVWNTSSPYSGTTSAAYLNGFRGYRTSFTGDLAHLLFFGPNVGGMAYLDVLCNSTYRYAISDLYNGAVENVPTYSWVVNVITHEQGHNMGSPHTHDCAWNGNNTQIDGCGAINSGGGDPPQGDCAVGPIPQAGGTIMSYCHVLYGIGMDFTQGFGPQPTALIHNRINAASCLATCGNACDHPWSGHASSIGTGAATLNWTADGATGYALQWRESGAGGAWNEQAGLTSTSYVLTGLTPGTEYEFRLQSTCSGGSSPWSGSFYFTTACEAFTVPFVEGFSGFADGSFPLCWSARNQNPFGDWFVSQGTWNLGSYAARFVQFNSAGGDADNWLFSPGLQLVGGTTYYLSFDYASPPQAPGKMSIHFGNAPTVSAMSSQIADLGAFSTGPLSASHAFTPATTGVYHVGWHVYSDQMPIQVDVNNILIVDQQYCAPTDSYNNVYGITNVTFNAINNSTTSSGAYHAYLDQSTTVSKGDVHALTVRLNTNGAIILYAKAWIDWDRNGVFDASEAYNLGTAYNVTDGATTLSPVQITVPATAVAGVTRMRVRAGYSSVPEPCGVHDFGEAEDYTIIIAGDEPELLKLDVRAFLQGPFNSATGLMNDNLRAAGLIPLTEPYTAMGFTQYGGGGETTTGTVLATTGNRAVVDWVLVELRELHTPATVLATRCGLLLRDGSVVDVDGSSPLAFDLAPGDYRVAVRHRNHLGVLSGYPVTFGGTTATWDFTQPGTPTYGTEALKEAGDHMVMWMGDATVNRQLQYTGSGNDRDMILQRVGGGTPNNVVAGYYVEDCSMNGQVSYTGSGNDRDPILENIGGTYPNAIRTEQLPH